MAIEKAILAGGCFWGVEELIRDLPGVTRTIVGYTGGDVPNATYRNHGSHAEAIAITFDNNVQKIYLNGELVGYGPKQESAICAGEPIRLGVWWQQDPLFFTGYMDQLRIYNRVVSYKEIKELVKQ